MKHTVYFRKRVVINTDPQRRCYNGVNFSESVSWTEWERLASWETKEAAEACARAYKNDPPHGRQYEVRKGD